VLTATLHVYACFVLGTSAAGQTGAALSGGTLVKRDLATILCKACDALRRQPWTDAVHATLKKGPEQRRPQGTTQLFSCTGCATRWERFRRTAGWSISSIWRIV
jgi:hypothetical protein